MNKSVPLWLVLVLVSLALLPTVYLLGVRQGEKHEAASGQIPSKVPAATQAPAGLPANHTPIPAAATAPFTHFRVGNRNVKSLLAEDDVVWVGTSGGVIRYDVRKDDYTVYDVNNKSLVSNGIFHLSKLHHLLLVGTYGGGLSVLDTGTGLWRNYNIPDGLADQFVYDAEHLPNGDLWIASWSGVNYVPGADLQQTGQWKTYNKDNTHGGLPNDWVYGVESDSKGAVWFATEFGVARFYQDKWQNWNNTHGLGADYELVKDDITFNADPAAKSQHHAQQKSDQGFSRVKGAYNPNYVVCLEVGPDDSVWAGTWGGGLARFDGKTWRNYTVKQGLPSNHVFSLYLDPQSHLWIGTSEGLALYQPAADSFKVFKQQNGLFADNVFSLSMDSHGRLWAGSFGGVARLDKILEQP